MSAVLILSIAFMFNAQAQGFRYGTLQYRILDSTDVDFTVRFSFYQEWDEASIYFTNGGNGVSVTNPPMLDTLPNFFFGDGGVIDLMMPIEAIDNGVVKGTSVFTHTYARASNGTADTTYVAQVLATPRTNIINNNSGGFYRIQTTILEHAKGYDSPSINVNPITKVGIGNIGSFDLFTSIDEGAINDTYAISADIESGLFGVGNTTPAVVAAATTPLNTNTGIVSYDATGATAGFYPFQVKITDDHGGSAVVDFIIEVLACTTQPTWTVNTPADNTAYTISVGQAISFTLEGVIGDVTNNALDIIPTPLPAGSSLSNITVSGNTYTATFNWTPAANQQGDYILAFAINDVDANGNEVCLDNTRTFHINVNECQQFSSISSTSVTYYQPANFAVDYPGEPLNEFYAGITDSAMVCLETPGFGNVNYAWDVDGVLSSSKCVVLTSIPNNISVTGTWINENNCTATFSNVVVTVGSIPKQCGPTTITQIELGKYCQGGAVLVANSPGAVSWLWSNGDTDSTTQIFASGTYSVVITTQSGCTDTASIVVNYKPEDHLSSYIMIAKKEVELEESTVLNGGIGVLHKKGEAEIEDHSYVTGATTFVMAKKIEVKHSSVVSTKIYGRPNITLPAFLYATPGGSNVKVPKNTTMTLTDSVYKKIEVEEHATVIFTHNDVSIKELETEEDATVEFSGCSILRIKKELHIDEDNSFNPQGYQVNIFVQKHEAEIEEGTTFNGSIYCLDEIEVEGDDHHHTYMNGFYIAKEIESEHYVTWNWSTVCGTDCPTPSGSNKTAPIDEFTPDQKLSVRIIAYPNPFVNSFDVEITTAYDDNVDISVYDMKGMLIESHNNIDPEHIPSLGEFAPPGLYIVKVTQRDVTEMIKVIKMK